MDYEDGITKRIVSPAIMISSSVGLTRTLVELASVEINGSPGAIRPSSRAIPGNSRPSAGAAPDLERVFADTAGEDERFQLTQDRGLGPDPRLHPVAVDVDRGEPRVF